MKGQRAGFAIIASGIAALVFALGGCGAGGDGERAGELAERAAAEIDAMIADGRELLVELADRPALAVVDPEEIHGHPETGAAADARQRLIERTRRRFSARCTSAVREVAEQSAAYRAIGRARADTIGGVDCISRPLEQPMHVGDEVFFLRAYADGDAEGGLAVGDYAFDGESFEQFLPIGMSIPGGVVFAELHLGALWQRLAAIERGEGADIVVTDANGTIIARPALPYWIGRSLAGRDELIDAMLERDSGTGTFEVEDRERLYSFTTPAASGGSIRVAAGVPR